MEILPAFLCAVNNFLKREKIKKKILHIIQSHLKDCISCGFWPLNYGKMPQARGGIELAGFAAWPSSQRAGNGIFTRSFGWPGDIGGFNHVTTIQVCHTNDKRLWLCGYYWVVFGILTYLRSSYQTIGRNYASLAKPWRDLKQLMIASISFKSLETRSFTHGQWFVEIPSFRELKSGWIRCIRWKFTSFTDLRISKRSFQVPTSFGSFGSPEVQPWGEKLVAFFFIMDPFRQRNDTWRSMHVPCGVLAMFGRSCFYTSTLRSIARWLKLLEMTPGLMDVIWILK